MVRTKRLLWLAVVLFVVVVAFSILPPYAKYCDSNYSNHYYFAAYEVTAAFGAFVDHHDGAVTALATVLLAFITAGLVYVARLQIRTTQAQMRAYIHISDATIIHAASADRRAARQRGRHRHGRDRRR